LDVGIFSKISEAERQEDKELEAEGEESEEDIGKFD
jgi:hypothetical protein